MKSQGLVKHRLKVWIGGQFLTCTQSTRRLPPWCWSCLMSLRASRQQLASLQTWTNFYDNSRGASQWTKTFACHLLVWSPTYNGPCSSRCRRSWWAARGSGPHTATCTEGQSGASQLMGLTWHLPIVRSRWEQQVKCSNNFQNFFNYTDRLINFESVSKLKPRWEVYSS